MTTTLGHAAVLAYRTLGLPLSLLVWLIAAKFWPPAVAAVLVAVCIAIWKMRQGGQSKYDWWFELRCYLVLGAVFLVALVATFEVTRAGISLLL